MTTEAARSLQLLRELERIKLDGLRFRIVDAKGLVVGRIASAIATILQGKDKPTYTPGRNNGDVVIVVNAAHLHFTHDKWHSKTYKWHTGWAGGFRERVAAEQWDKDPSSILIKAVSGMLPKNRLRPYRLDKLKVFPESDHPYAELPLVPFVPLPRRMHLPGLHWPLPSGLQPMNPEKYAFRAWAGSATPRSRTPPPSAAAPLPRSASPRPATLTSSSGAPGQSHEAAGGGPRSSTPSSSQPSASASTHDHAASSSGRKAAGGRRGEAGQASPAPQGERPGGGARVQVGDEPPAQGDVHAASGLAGFMSLLTEEEQRALRAAEQGAKGPG